MYLTSVHVSLTYLYTSQIPTYPTNTSTNVSSCPTITHVSLEYPSISQVSMCIPHVSTANQHVSSYPTSTHVYYKLAYIQQDLTMPQIPTRSISTSIIVSSCPTHTQASYQCLNVFQLSLCTPLKSMCPMIS